MHDLGTELARHKCGSTIDRKLGAMCEAQLTLHYWERHEYNCAKYPQGAAERK